MVLGVPIINQLGVEYENAFREKAGSLLKLLNLKALAELEVTVVLITFSTGHNTPFCVSPKGEVVFIVRDVPQLRKQNLESFEAAITHELFHLYINNKLGLGISPKLHHAFSFVSGTATNVADDIELIKIAVEKDVTILLLDEVKRTNTYYKDLNEVTSLGCYPDHIKFRLKMSLTWTYASTQWLSETVKDPKLREGFVNNLRLVEPHYQANGYPRLKDLIIQLLNGEIATTTEKAENMVDRVLEVCNEFLDLYRMNLQ